MASQKFQKLKLNTRAPLRVVQSPLASIAATQDCTESDSTHNVAIHTKDAAIHGNTAFTLEDLTLETAPSSHVGSYGDVEDNDGIQEQDFGAATSFSTSNLSSLQSSYGNRKPSITFDEQVVLEDGKSARLGRPLPRAESWLGPGETADSEDEREPLHVRVHSETEMARYDRRTGKPLGRRKGCEGQPYQKGELRHPLLQTTVDELAQADRIINQHGEDSETSSPGVLSPSAGLLSPVREYVASPAAYPPAHTNGTWLTRRSDSLRISNHRAELSSMDSSGRPSRRRSTRSNQSGSSMSPALSFLGQFSARSEPKPVPADAEGQEIGESRYIIGKQIGYGGFSVIKEVFTLEGSTRIRRAVKIVRKQIEGENNDENDRVQLEFEHEVSIWRYLHHPNILPLIEVHDSEFATYCITKLNEGGTLFDLIRSRRHQPRKQWGLPATLARRYIYQLGSALRYLHEDMRIVHRDVKLENCLIDMSSPHAAKEGGTVLLCDFGFADFTHNDSRDNGDEHLGAPHRKFGPSETSTSVMGSINYVAPEVLNSPRPIYSTAVDMWALGIITYALLTGELPFSHEFQPRLILMITKGEWDERPLLEAPAVKLERDGADAVEFVRACLQLDHTARWHISQALESRWLEGCYEPSSPDAENRFA